MQGWIKLHRQLLDWEWYDDINTSRLFVHLLLVANHEDKNWRGVEIKRGQRLTSLDKLSKETGLSVSQIRTCLKKLKSTSEVTSKSHSQHTVFTIENYDSYQGSDKQNDKPLAYESQANDKPLATNKNDKKEKNVTTKEKLDWSATQMSAEEIQEIKRIRKSSKADVSQRVINQLAKQFELSRKRGFTNDDILNEWSIKGWRSYKDEWMKGNPTRKPEQQLQIEIDPQQQRDELSQMFRSMGGDK